MSKTNAQECSKCHHSIQDHRYKGRPRVCVTTELKGSDLGICGCDEHAYDKIMESTS